MESSKIYLLFCSFMEMEQNVLLLLLNIEISKKNIFSNLQKYYKKMLSEYIAKLSIFLCQSVLNVVFTAAQH